MFFGVETLQISSAPLGADFWLRKVSEPKREEHNGIDRFLILKNPTHFWRPSRIRFLAPKKLRNPNGRKIMESIGFWYSNPTHFWRPSRIRFLARKKTPEPKRDLFFWLRKSSGAHHGRKKSLQNSIPGTSTLRIPITVATC